MSRKTANRLLATLAALSCVVTGAYLIRSGFWSRNLRELEESLQRDAGLGRVQDIQVDVRAHFPIRLSEPFSLFILVRNTGPSSQVLRSIDFPLDLNERIEITGTNPPYEVAKLTRGSSWRALRYHEPIGPGETLTIELKARAVGSGTATDPVHVCLNSEFTCLPIQLNLPILF